MKKNIQKKTFFLVDRQLHTMKFPIIPIMNIIELKNWEKKVHHVNKFLKNAIYRYLTNSVESMNR